MNGFYTTFQTLSSSSTAPLKRKCNHLKKINNEMLFFMHNASKPNRIKNNQGNLVIEWEERQVKL